MSWYKPSDLGFAVRCKLSDLGYAARLFMKLVWSLGASLRRFALLPYLYSGKVAPQRKIFVSRQIPKNPRCRLHGFTENDGKTMRVHLRSQRQ